MKQDKDWIDVMRSSLRDAELTPPDGGWERLAGELGAVKSPRPAWRIYWPRIAAAAVVLLCIVAGEILLHGNKGVITDGNVIVPVADGSGVSATSSLQPASIEAEAPVLAALTQGGERAAEAVDRKSLRSVAASRIAMQAFDRSADPELAKESAATSPSASDVLAVSTNAAAKAEETVSAAKDKSSAAASAVTGRSVAATRSVSAGNAHKTYGNDLFAEAAPRRNKTSLGLFGGGGMVGGRDGGDMRGMLASAMTSGSNLVILPREAVYSDYEFNHRLPLSFGVAVRKDFAYGLSLESGVNYTLLMSEAKVPYGTKDITQKLHFIGVPLRLNWRFFERNRFSLYIGAGGQLEKCVSAKFGSHSVKEDKLQWSASAAAGAQYRLGGMVALYFEPEGSYYFTRTALRTARTDSPMTFSLRLGVRLSF